MTRTTLQKMLAATAASLMMAASAFCFDWPQTTDTAQVFSLFFGQSVGSSFETSMLFDKADTILAAENGTVLFRNDDTLQANGWFPSTFGNSVILAHTNNMITVYGNLDTVSLSDNDIFINQGKPLGFSGGDGWNSGRRGLEFGVYDTKVQTIINPFLLMPQLAEKKPLAIKNVTAWSKNDAKFALDAKTRMPAGIYRLYLDKQESNMTYRTIVSINGAVVETITYTILKQVDGRLCFSGNGTYPYTTIFPDTERQFLAEAIFSNGTNTVTVTVQDIFGNQKQTTYTVVCY